MLTSTCRARNKLGISRGSYGDLKRKEEELKRLRADLDAAEKQNKNLLEETKRLEGIV